jgi:hypothetical protein
MRGTRIDDSAAKPQRRDACAASCEPLSALGVRPRQLSVGTPLAGILLRLWDCRPAHLTRLNEALLGLVDVKRQIESWWAT